MNHGHARRPKFCTRSGCSAQPFFARLHAPAHILLAWKWWYLIVTDVNAARNCATSLRNTYACIQKPAWGRARGCESVCLTPPPSQRILHVRMAATLLLVTASVFAHYDYGDNPPIPPPLPPSLPAPPHPPPAAKRYPLDPQFGRRARWPCEREWKDLAKTRQVATRARVSSRWRAALWQPASWIAAEDA